MVFDQFNKFYLISMSILLTSCWMIYGYYRKKLHLNHFLYAVINHERISNSCTCTTLFCRAVKWKLKCLKQRRKAGNWELLKIWNCKFIFLLLSSGKKCFIVTQFCRSVILCFHLPFFFGPITEQSIAKKQKQSPILMSLN